MQYIAVGFTSNALRIFNRETAQYYRIPYAFEGTTHQVNQIISSPTKSLLVAAHDDKLIRFNDVLSNSCIKDMVGHTDSVSTVSIDTSGLYLVSGAQEILMFTWNSCSSKKIWWSRTYIAHHPTLPLMASGGADSLVKLFESNIHFNL